LTTWWWVRRRAPSIRSAWWDALRSRLRGTSTSLPRWADFERLADKLEKRGRSAHSFLVEGVEVDVVPYGGIEGEDRTILGPMTTG
jgi:predicted nucleotidyltransferase